MKYNPVMHHRRSIRLREYDYAQAGAYFVTICAQDRQCLFGEIEAGGMRLNDMGRIVAEQWDAIPRRFTNVDLDAFVVMPNHIHGIFLIVGASLAGAQTHDNTGIRIPIGNRTNVGAPLAGAQKCAGTQNHATANYRDATAATPINRAPARGAPTVGDIVGAYKSLCVHHGLKWIKQNQPGLVLGKLWQRNYWEHIVRDESELNRIREYIGNNPAQWEMDNLFISSNCPDRTAARPN